MDDFCPHWLSALYCYLLLVLRVCSHSICRISLAMVAMAAMAARCAPTGLFSVIEAPSSATAPASSSKSACTAFFPTNIGSEFIVSKSPHGGRKLALNVDKSKQGRRSCAVAARASGAGLMEGAAPPATREEPVVVNVDLGDRSYPIYIGAGLLNQPELLQNHVTGKKVQFTFPVPCNPLFVSLSMYVKKVGINMVLYKLLSRRSSVTTL